MKIICSILILIMAIASCGQRPTKSDLETIEISLNDGEELQIDSIIDEISLIPLNLKGGG